MNAQNRKDLAALIARADDLVRELESLKDAVEQMAEDEREKFDNMSEGLQQGEKGQAIDEAASALEEMKDELETALNSLTDFAGRDIP